MADKHDAELMIQLAQWGTMMGIDKALDDLFSDSFDAESATIENESVRHVLQFGETIGTLTKNGLISTELVLDWLWIAGLWERVGPAALKQREKYGVSQLYENMEALAARQSPPA